jgi:hypothetical protein
MQYYKHRFQLPDRPDTTIFVQTEDEVERGNAIIASVLELWSPPGNFYHLQKGGHISALRRHKHDQQFARLDIENFFGSVTRNKVHRALKNIGFSFADAAVVSHRSCVQHNGRRVLPFGYVQSPLLASLVLHKSALGNAIKALGKNGLFVSIFMDDILISHPDSANAVSDGIAVIEHAAAEARFTLSAVKRQGPATAISAFNIDLAHESLVITPARLDDFEQRVRVLGKCPVTDGILGYVEAVNDQQFEYLNALM